MIKINFHKLRLIFKKKISLLNNCREILQAEFQTITESREKIQVTGATEKKVLFIFSTTGNFTGSFSMS